MRIYLVKIMSGYVGLDHSAQLEEPSGYGRFWKARMAGIEVTL